MALRYIVGNTVSSKVIKTTPNGNVNIGNVGKIYQLVTISNGYFVKFNGIGSPVFMYDSELN
jgi:hypothetical protein